MTRFARKNRLARSKALHHHNRSLQFERLEDRALLDGSGQLAPLPSEIEPNDTLETANSAAANFVALSGTNLYQLGVKANSTSTFVNGDKIFDKDFFNLGALEAGDILTVTLSGNSSLRGTNPDPILKLYQGNIEQSITIDDDRGPGTDSLIHRFHITATDTYYVEMNADIWKVEGSYDLGMFLENAGAAPATGGTVTTETESNETVATATDISTSWRRAQYLSRTSANLTVGDVDVFSYHFAAGDLVSINVDSTSALEAQFSLRDSTGAIIALENGESLEGDAPIYSFIISTTGTYFVEASAVSGAGDYNADVYLSTDTPPLANSSPVVVDLNVTSLIEENGSATVSGTISDSNSQDSHLVVITWGPGEGSTTINLAAGETAFSESHPYADDNPTGTAADTYPISVVVTDSHGASGSAAAAVTVANVAPVITNLSNSSASGGGAVERQTISIGATFTDIGVLDTHTAVIHWGDGTTSAGSVTGSGGAGSVSGSHAYTAGGIYTITLLLDDDDRGSATQTTTTVISGVGVNQGVLYIIGTQHKDQVQVSQDGSRLKVDADFLAGNKVRTFAAAGITRIVAFLYDGKDQVQISNDNSKPAYIDAGAGDDQIQAGGGNNTVLGGAGKDQIQTGEGNNYIDGGDGDDQIQAKGGNDTVYGGAGNDKIQAGGGRNFLDGGAGNDELNGGNGSDVILGGDGDDKLTGGKGRDVLIGGAGADHLVSNGGDDILIGGTTHFDANREALLAVLAEWNSGLSLAQRVARLRNGTGPLLMGVKLVKGATVFDDVAADKLAGASGDDWFFYELGKDKLSGNKKGAILN